MNKRIFCLWLAGICGSASGVDLSFAAMFNYETVTAEGTGGLSNKMLSDLASVGIVVDVPLGGNFGFSTQESVRFSDISLSSAGGGYNKNIYWDGIVGGAYHFAGYDHFADPYILYGVGSSGAVYFDERASSWRTKTALVIYPAVGIGGNLNFHGLLIGTNLRLIVISINPSPLTTYEQFPVTWTFSVGARL